MKKVIAVILITVLIICSYSVAFATSARTSEIEDYIEFYEIIGTDTTIIESSNNHAILTTKYVYNERETLAYIDIRSFENGDVAVTVTEGGLTQTMVYKEDGRMLLEGAVAATVTATIDNMSINGDIILNDDAADLLGRRSVTWQTEVPFGDEDDYDDDLLTVRYDITFSERVSNIAESHLFSIILGQILGQSFPGDTPDMMFLRDEIIATDIYVCIDWLVNNNPSTDSMSSKRVQYIHGTRGQIINGQHIFKYQYTYYGAEGCPENYKIKQSTPFYCIIETD